MSRLVGSAGTMVKPTPHVGLVTSNLLSSRPDVADVAEEQVVANLAYILLAKQIALSTASVSSSNDSKRSEISAGAVLSYSIQELAEATSLSRSILYEAIQRQQLTAHKLGRRTVVLRCDAIAWLNALPTVASSSEKLTDRQGHTDDARCLRSASQAENSADKHPAAIHGDLQIQPPQKSAPRRKKSSMRSRLA